MEYDPPGGTVAVWGCGPVGQFAIKSAFLLGAERVIAINPFHYSLLVALQDAPGGYDMFKDKEGNCVKVVLKS